MELLKLVSFNNINIHDAEYLVTSWNSKNDFITENFILILLDSVSRYIVIGCASFARCFDYKYKNNLGKDGLGQDCSISSAYALEILQSCTKPSQSCTKPLIFSYINSRAFQHVHRVTPSTMTCDRVEIPSILSPPLWGILSLSCPCMAHGWVKVTGSWGIRHFWGISPCHMSPYITTCGWLGIKTS